MDHYGLSDDSEDDSKPEHQFTEEEEPVLRLRSDYE